ncbi:hypothetical protein FC15_GL001217 [Lapidilactobacillus concavus DSM 17758]|uniref:Uncharacterized protein n=1 Tax=Lapidilactobacillus concavus DSM 17758 TaxID=1423735 RepID=A0A0R1W5J0_9LACO|nr:hypothetical protein FC15_GL001217 [Lapidilactobacillus concavus DSM 17758]
MINHFSFAKCSPQIHSNPDFYIPNQLKIIREKFSFNNVNFYKLNENFQQHEFLNVILTISDRLI